MMNTKLLSKFGTFFAAAAVLLASGAANADDKQFADNMKKYLETDAGQKELGTAVENYFKKRQQEAMKEEQDKAAAEMENQFKNPVKIDPGTSPAMGPAGAKVTIVEFSDFQCPFCKRGRDTVKEVAKAYPNDVKLVFKNLPLQMHPQAMPAAKAALAAGKQGKFWEYHDALFDNQSKLTAPNFFEEQAKTLGLDVERFKKDMSSPDIEKEIKADTEIAQKLDINGTPAFFVNGVAIRGAYPVDHFKKIIDRHLGKPAA